MRDRPQQNHRLEWPGGVVPEWARAPQGNGKRRGKNRGGQGGGGGNAKRERLQKVMAQSGHGSRRNIEILIAQGHITINGQVAKLGDSVGPSDKVKLDGNVINLRFGDPLPRVLVYHKNTGEIVTRDDPQKRPTVFDRLPKVNGGRWVSVGRLDFNTEGLLIFTTSGELANRLTHPRFEVEREYAVRVLGDLTDEVKAKLLEGVDIDGELCKFDSIEDRGGEGANHWHHVVLREGKNREVRRMMEAVGLTVSRLMRVRFGCVELPGHVKRGMMKEMDEEQVQTLLQFSGMNEPPPSAGDADEEDEFDNIGNRAPDPARERHVERVPEDDLGNRVIARETAPAPEADGNRGTYGEGFNPAKHDPQQRREGRPGGKSFGHGKKRGRGHGHGNADGNVMHHPGQGNANGNVAHGGQGGQGGQHHQQHRKHGQGKPHGQGQNQNPGNGNGNAPGPQGQNAQGQGQGHGKPGRHRRHKNRNRNRGGQDGRPQGGETPQPATGGDREPG
ncbi:MAG TPA: pseudouridine synthase [Usitatibacter sp.]|nr:pseudouridine synthase [Usitatibacter sp.]